VLDSYGWVEYAIGSEMGDLVRVALESGTCYTPSIVIAELADKFSREGQTADWENLYNFVRGKTKILILDANSARQSGLRKTEIRTRIKDFGLADAIIYQASVENGALLVTGDEHFEDFQDVIYLKRIEEAREKIQNVE
jgi:predicted nucleic acid-binding protein